MTVSPLNVLLVDDDPAFRLGLRIWLDQQPEFQVIGEADTAAAVLQQLETCQTAAISSQTDAGVSTPSPAVDIVVLDLGLGQGDPETLPGLQLCGDIKRQFPQVPVLVLSVHGEPVLQAAAQQMGADGFGLRGLPVRALARLIQRVATQPATTAAPPEMAVPQSPTGPVAYLRQSSLRQINAAIAAIEVAATQPLPYWYRLVLAGQHRELRAAKWLMGHLLPAPESTANPSSDTLLPTDPMAPAISGPTDSLTWSPAGTATRVPWPPPIAVGDVRTRVCEAVFRKLQCPLENRSDLPLEIDILRSDKARELLYMILRAFESLLDDVHQAQVPPGHLDPQTPAFLHDLWETVTTDFFGRYYTPPIDGLEQPLVAALYQEAAVVQAAILNRIPGVSPLLAHLLFQASLEIDGATYVATTPEALRRSQFLLENLLIQVACAVMQPVLNRFADVEFLKRSLYQRRILSSREITRFRNDLSWRYRWDSLINDPKAIFESQHRLFTLTSQGLQVHWVYAPRQAELETLSGLQYVLTLALEARDAIAPRFRTAISLVGSGVVFVLTEVIGRGIGLIGRGVAKGIGNAWQDSRWRQRQRDEASRLP